MKTPAQSPFKFLDAYGKDDKAIFFGRRQETLELYDRIFETNLVLLYGASGTGKTSLINCGLGNEFEASDWHPIFIRREENLMTSFKEKLKEHAIKKQPEDISLPHFIQSLYLDYFKPIYLIFDQFEELFILGDKEEQKAFFEAIYEILNAHISCKILISMREEYIAYISDFERIVPTLFDNRLRVEKMNTRKLEEVIEGTSTEFNIQLSNTENHKISALILEKLKNKNNEIELVNLQVYLDRLYRLDQEREPGSVIIFDEELINTTGNLDDVMAYFLDEQLDSLEKELEQKFETKTTNIPLKILFELVTDNGTKQTVDIQCISRDLKNNDISAPIVEYCVKRFREMRILRELS
jgi:GTPase SAR1 family protein